MSQAVECLCDQHSNRFDCPDCLVNYLPKFREYGLIVHDGGTSCVRIRFCPWCGSTLPESLRKQWFAELEALGIDPGNENVPERYQSSEWWAVRGVAPDDLVE
jgi:hypothetical protein